MTIEQLEQENLKKLFDENEKLKVNLKICEKQIKRLLRLLNEKNNIN